MQREPAVERLEERSLLTANPVIGWNAVALEAIRLDRTPPPVAARDLAILQTAVYDAVDSVAPIGPAYRVHRTAQPGTSVPAAVTGAAFETLTQLFPHQRSLFNAEWARIFPALPQTVATANGLALGKVVADAELSLRVKDGSTATVGYTPNNAPGNWRPTPPTNTPAVLPWWGNVRPFVLKSPRQFTVPGPPPLTSAQYAAEVNQLESLGSVHSTARTPDQTQIANFWADGTGTETPPGHWNAIAEQLATQRGDSIARSARVFAVLDTALADAGIACWNVKYATNRWRSITAIRQANLDGNPATQADPSWSPLLPTPAFPAYVSGHSTFSAAAATVLAGFYGDRTPFATTSDALPGTVRVFPSFSAAADEAGMSRIYGGIHYLSDNLDGLALGRKIGQYALRHTLAVTR